MREIAKPEAIVLEGYGRTRTFEWQALDPSKAPYGSLWGLKGPGGTALLIFPRENYDSLVCCGLWSGVYPDSLAQATREIEHVLRTGENRDSDHHVRKAEFASWLKGGEE